MYTSRIGPPRIPGVDPGMFESTQYLVNDWQCCHLPRRRHVVQEWERLAKGQRDEAIAQANARVDRVEAEGLTIGASPPLSFMIAIETEAYVTTHESQASMSEVNVLSDVESDTSTGELAERTLQS